MNAVALGCVTAYAILPARSHTASMARRSKKTKTFEDGLARPKKNSARKRGGEGGGKANAHLRVEILNARKAPQQQVSTCICRFRVLS
jgi:hypothetical protein